MAAYLLNHLRIPGDKLNEESLRYLEQVKATVDPFGGRWLAQTTAVEVIEGAWPGAAVLLEFPDVAAAQAWYRSAEYQNIAHLRIDNAISDLVVFEAAAPGFDPADVARAVRAVLAA
jgi:uncharacterized protein (DUF1330 family)